MFSGGYLMSILLSNILFRLILTFTIPLLNKSSQSLFKQSADRKKSKILFLICLYIVCFCHNKKKLNKKLALSIFFVIKRHANIFLIWSNLGNLAIKSILQSNWTRIFALSRYVNPAAVFEHSLMQLKSTAGFELKSFC